MQEEKDSLKDQLAEGGRESRSIRRGVGMAASLLTPSQPEPPPEYLPYHFDQQGGNSIHSPNCFPNPSR